DAGAGSSRQKFGEPELLVIDAQLSQTLDTNLNPAGGIGCPNNPNSFMRRFYFSEHADARNPLTSQSVDVGISEAVADQNLTVNLYTIPSTDPVDTITLANLTLIGTGSRAISPANDDLTIVRVPVAGTVADTSSMDLAVEVTTPGAFFHGATTAGDTHPGFVLAPGCSINDPTPVQDIDPSFADTFIVMVVNEEDSCENPEAISWLSVGTSSGTVAPAGSANSTISVDATGLAA